MKKLLILAILLISCHVPKYTFSGDVNYKLDFSKGKWLLGDVKAPASITDKLTTNASEVFKRLLGDRFYTTRTVQNILIPAIISDVPSASVLDDIKNGTGFDYFISITTKGIRNDLGNIQIGDIDSPVKNTAEVILVIYDLNSLDEFYRQSVSGDLSIQKDTKDFAFAKSANDMIVSGLNKMMKTIEKNRKQY